MFSQRASSCEWWEKSAMEFSELKVKPVFSQSWPQVKLASFILVLVKISCLPIIRPAINHKIDNLWFKFFICRVFGNTITTCREFQFKNKPSFKISIDRFGSNNLFLIYGWTNSFCFNFFLNYILSKKGWFF